MLLKQGIHTSDAARDARSDMGLWLKSLREQQGMSQRDLANALNLDYYTFIAQLENGRGRIPPARYRDWAAALQVARGVCRRAERRVVAFAETEELNAQIIIYLNRLSDLLFVLARWVNAREKISEPIWESERG